MKDDVIFNLFHLNKYAIIDKPCTIIVKNNSILDYTKMYTKDDNYRWLLNIKVITQDNLDLMKQIVKQNAHLTYKDIGHLLMTAAIWEDQITDPIELPVKGENIIAVFDYVEEELLCTSVTLIPRVSPKIYLPAEELLKEINKFEQIIKSINE